MDWVNLRKGTAVGLGWAARDRAAQKDRLWTRAHQLGVLTVVPVSHIHHPRAVVDLEAQAGGVLIGLYYSAKDGNLWYRG